MTTAISIILYFLAAVLVLSAGQSIPKGELPEAKGALIGFLILFVLAAALQVFA